MRRRRAILLTILATAPLVLTFSAAAADANQADRAYLRQLHFDYGLVVACGFADDEVEAGYLLLAGTLERRLGIDADADARYRQLNLGWTEADADWAAAAGPVFVDWCRHRAPAAGDRFRAAFRDTGLTLEPRPKRVKP